MYNRAKYHPYQPPSMREAMKIFSKWLTKVKKLKAKKVKKIKVKKAKKIKVKKAKKVK